MSQPEKDSRSRFSAKAKSILATVASAAGALSGVATFLDADNLNKGLFLAAGSVAVALLVIGVVLALLRYQWATIATLVVVAALAIGGGIGYLVGRAGTETGSSSGTASSGPVPASPSAPPSDSPSPTPTPSNPTADASSTSPAPVRVSFDAPQPDDPPIPRQSAVDMNGTVEGLPFGHKLFIVSRTGDGDFFVVKGNTISDPRSYAAATQNGSWEARDGGVGSADDKPGTRFTFIPVDADPSCAAAMEKAGRHRDDHRIRSDEWPPTCQPVERRSSVTIR